MNGGGGMEGALEAAEEAMEAELSALCDALLPDDVRAQLYAADGGARARPRARAPAAAGGGGGADHAAASELDYDHYSNKGERARLAGAARRAARGVGKSRALLVARLAERRRRAARRRLSALYLQSCTPRFAPIGHAAAAAAAASGRGRFVACG
jgi:hypothetical protein